MRKHPLLPATALLLGGVAAGGFWEELGTLFVCAAGVAWLVWLAAEWFRFSFLATAALSAAVFLAGGSTWILNQARVEGRHVVRLMGEGEETLITLRARVSVPPEGETHGTRRFMARATEVWTGTRWQEVTGDIPVGWNAEADFAIHRGARVELLGWLTRPPRATNPGGFDPRERLAADRIFVNVRVPRESGLTILESGEGGGSLLARFRTFMREKLLAHTLDEDVQSARSMAALLLGYRDPALRDLSQSFADAGVAHLLAISGSHVVFFAGIVWWVLRFLPVRPRVREVIIACCVLAYVLATPCGPPVVRAAIALLMVLAARLLGRPRDYVSILCAAACAIVLVRPTDLHDAGFQLSFITAAGLVLLAERLYAFAFSGWETRAQLVAELSRARHHRWQLSAGRFFGHLLIANVIGVCFAAPLAAYHFGQVNPWAALSGLVALPFVSIAMVAGALQLLAEFLGIGFLLAPVSTLTATMMIWVVEKLAALPGAVLAVRPLPAWLTLALLSLLVLVIARRGLGLSRAMMVNCGVAGAVAVAGWYAWSAPRGVAELLVLDSKGGSSVLLRTSSGSLWLIDAGAGQSGGSSIVNSVLRPAMQQQGYRQLDGMVVTAFNVRHARDAGDAAVRLGPRQVWVPGAAWERRGQTLAGAQLSPFADRVSTLTTGQALNVDGMRMSAVAGGGERPLALMLEWEGRRILIADPAALLAEGGPGARCDVLILTAPPTAAALAMPWLADYTPDRVIWCGISTRGIRRSREGEHNTEEGAVAIQWRGGEIVIRDYHRVAGRDGE